MSVNILQLKITLKDIEPPIWRRVLVRDDISFHKLHKVIQAVMGWFECHLYEFRIGNSYITVETEEMDEDADIEDSKKLKLNKFSFKRGAKFIYMYDFGDEWLHEIHVEEILKHDEKAIYPICTEGKRNCPPENIGGPLGYGDFLDVIKNPGHPQYREFVDWIGEGFDPEEFDLKAANNRLEKEK